MIVLGYRFEPKVWAIIVTSILVLVFFQLGKWQLSRADEKNLRYEQLEQYAKQPTIKLSGTFAKLEDYQFRDVEVIGKYVPERTIYLDNKTYKGHAGYHIITPLKIENSELHVVVNRGWIATGNNRSILPPVAVVDENVKITGLVVSPELKTLQLGDDEVPGKVWGNFELQRYQKLTGLEMLPMMVLQKDDVKDGLIRDWNRPDSGAAKNLGYAVQWFLLAITAIIIFLALNVKRKN